MTVENGQLQDGRMAGVVVPSRVRRSRTVDGSPRPSVAIFGRSQVFVDALASSLTRAGSASVVMSCIDIEGGLRVITGLAQLPQIVLVHAAVTGGTRAVVSVREALPASSVIVMGVDPCGGDPLGWAEAGALGILDLGAGIHELSSTIRAVAGGHAMCSPSVTAALLERLTRSATAAGSGSRSTLLTLREGEVAGLLAEGLSNKEIARRLNIQVATVKNHVHNVLTKLEVSNRAQARIQSRGTWDPHPSP